MKLYYSAMKIAELMHCSFDDAIITVIFTLIVFFALLGWATGLFMEFGLLLYSLTRKLFKAARKAWLSRRRL